MRYVIYLAERVGFEPSVPHKGTTVFETAPIDRSGTSPLTVVPYRSGDRPRQHAVESIHGGAHLRQSILQYPSM